MGLIHEQKALAVASSSVHFHIGPEKQMKYNSRKMEQQYNSSRNLLGRQNEKNELKTHTQFLEQSICQNRNLLHRQE